MIRETILQGDTDLLEQQLTASPDLANQLIIQQTGKAYRVHPIHWICDVVFEKKIPEATALKMVRLLVAAGTDVNGNIPGSTSKDTPLITSVSLYCDTIATYLLDHGADTTPRGTHGGTALHWAAWVGSAIVVERLLREAVILDDQGDEFHSTPILWAVNGWLNPNPRNKRKQPEAVKLLLAAGADPNCKNEAGQRAIDILQEHGEKEMLAILQSSEGF